MQNGIPKISVVIPTLNEEKYLPFCLESLTKQTFKEFEIIIADGNSTDKTQEIAHKYTKKVIRTINHSINRLLSWTHC